MILGRGSSCFHYVGCIFLVLALGLWNGQLIAQQTLQSHKKLSPSELKVDAGVLEQSLRFARPMLDKEFTSEWMDKRFRKLNAELTDSLSYLEFLRKVALLLTETRSFDVSWGHSREFSQFRNTNIPLFPIRFEVCNGRFFVVEALNGEDWEKGTEILSINGVPCQKYLKENYPLLPIEGVNHFVQDRWLEAYYPNHHANFWEQPDTFSLVCLDAGGKKMTRKVAAVLRADLTTPALDPHPLIAKDEITQITILDLRDYHLYRNPLPDWRLDSLLGNLQSAPVLVLDLTGYSGIDLQFGAFLLSRLYPDAHSFFDRMEDFSVDGKGGWRLWKPDSLAAPPIPFALPWTYQVYPGKLVVVVDGATNSFKRLLASHLSRRPDTQIVGELPNGNAFSVLADQEIRQLPHSGITISIPKVRISVKAYAMEGQNQLALDKEFTREPGRPMQGLVLDWLAKEGK